MAGGIARRFSVVTARAASHVAQHGRGTFLTSKGAREVASGLARQLRESIVDLLDVDDLLPPLGDGASEVR